MGIDYAIACTDCREFVALHKWPILEAAALDVHGRAAFDLPGISNGPLAWLDMELVATAVAEPIPSRGFITELQPVLRQFAADHAHHHVAIACDNGLLPWEFGEPAWDSWKEVQGPFFYDSAYLPRNLIDDYGLTRWADVLELLRQKAEFLLHPQLEEDLQALRIAFTNRVHSTTS